MRLALDKPFQAINTHLLYSPSALTVQNFPCVDQCGRRCQPSSPLGPVHPVRPGVNTITLSRCPRSRLSNPSPRPLRMIPRRASHLIEGELHHHVGPEPQAHRLHLPRRISTRSRPCPVTVMRISCTLNIKKKSCTLCGRGVGRRDAWLSLALARMLAASSKCVVYSSPDSAMPVPALLLR